jgi:2-polyprenyl-3-methyl-5-hydroxy-6-metoxy-1,4-benzoquinol methylase
MPSRINFVLVLTRRDNLQKVISEALGLFSATVKRWEVIARGELTEVNETVVQNAVDADQVALAVTSSEPNIRAHVSRNGQFDVVTISFSERLQHAATAAKVVRRLEGVVAAAIGEELEMTLDASGLPIFIGEEITVLIAKRQARL